MAKARKWEETNASSGEVYAANCALISSREDFDILNQQLIHGSAAETLQKKRTVETCQTTRHWWYLPVRAQQLWDCRKSLCGSGLWVQ